MTEKVRRILMRRDGAMDMASRGGRGGRGGSGMRGGSRGGRGGRSDGHYPYMPPYRMGRGDYRDYEMEDGRRGVRRSRDYEGGSMGDSSSDGGYDGNYMEDGRRGVKGSGRGRRRMRDRGEMPFSMKGEVEYEEDSRYEDEDYGYEDYGYGGGDYGYEDYAGEEIEDMRLTKHDMMKWKRELINADGSRGEHFHLDKIMPIAQKLGIRFDEYSEKEFCLVVNMLYSDYCEVNKAYISPENELMYYVKLAKAWLEDEDAPEGSEKLALYYHCVVSQD